MNNFKPNRPTDEQFRIITSGKGEDSKRSVIETAVRYLRGGVGASSGNKSGTSSSYKEQEESRLREFISKNKLWNPPVDLGVFVEDGGEHKVYFTSDMKYAIKMNNLEYYDCWEEYLYNLLFHNYFFEATSYELLGFKEEDGRLLSIVRQIRIIKNQKPTLKEIQKDLFYIGFVSVDELDYCNYDLNVILSDVDKDNVLKRDGVLYYIDTVFSPNKKPLYKNGGEVTKNNFDIFELLFGFKF